MRTVNTAVTAWADHPGTKCCYVCKYCQAELSTACVQPDSTTLPAQTATLMDRSATRGRVELQIAHPVTYTCKDATPIPLPATSPDPQPDTADTQPDSRLQPCLPDDKTVGEQLLSCRIADLMDLILQQRDELHCVNEAYRCCS